MNKPVKYNPLEEIRSLQRHFFGDNLVDPSVSKNLPTTDVYTKDNDLIVEAHLPNFNGKDIDVQVDGEYLIINAEHHEEETDKSKKYIVRESSNSFYRRIALPERADIDHIKANVSDGVLYVEVPLAPLPEPKKVAIKPKNK